MYIIVAADNNWAIGNKGQLLVTSPNDQKHFREETAGKVVVMGRKSLVNFPQGMPLAGRTSIILSKDPKFTVKGGIVVHSIEELQEELKKYPSQDVYVIGGDSVFKQLLPYCDVVHVTKIDHEYQADTYFPNLDKDKDWVITADSDELTYFDIAYEFFKYERRRS